MNHHFDEQVSSSSASVLSNMPNSAKCISTSSSDEFANPVDSRFRSHSSASGDPMDVDSIPDGVPCSVTVLKDILLDTRRRGIRIMMLRY